MSDLKTRVLQAIHALHYDFHQFSIPDFVAYLEKTRQRDIIMKGAPFDAGLHGLWVRGDTADYIFFDNHTYAIHRVHHILHELGHLALEHQPRDLAGVLPPAWVAQLTTLIGASPCGHCRMWEVQQTLEDREAECFVRLLQHEILNAGRMFALTHPVTSIEEMDRLTRSLGYND